MNGRETPAAIFGTLILFPRENSNFPPHNIKPFSHISLYNKQSLAKKIVLHRAVIESIYLWQFQFRADY